MGEEIAYFKEGPVTICLYPRTTICQLIVEEVAGVPFKNDGQFHGQTQRAAVFVRRLLVPSEIASCLIAKALPALSPPWNAM